MGGEGKNQAGNEIVLSVKREESAERTRTLTSFKVVKKFSWRSEEEGGGKKKRESPKGVGG